MQTTVGFAGMSSAEETELRKLFEQANAANGGRFVEAEQSSAEILLVDVDSIHGHMTWLQTQSDRERRIIALSARSTPHSDFCIVKPASLQSMGDALAAMAAASTQETAHGVDAGAEGAASSPQSDAGPAGTAEPGIEQRDVDAVEATAEGSAMDHEADPAGAAEVEPTVDTPGEAVGSGALPAGTSADGDHDARSDAGASTPARLADYLSGNALAGPARLKLDTAPELVVDPGAKTYLGPTQLKGFAAYARAEQIDASQWEPLDPAELAGLAAQAGQPQPWSRLVWLSGLYGSPGRLADGHSATDRFELLRWPQIEREFPRHFRIATTMMKGPATAAEIAEVAGSPIDEVIDFINASMAAGQARRAEPEPETDAAPAQRGLLDRLKGLRGN